jgi:hypothetical protein
VRLDHDDDDTARAVARLPRLAIAVEHRRSENAERISIHLQAVPSFAAFGDAFDALNPFAFWMKATQLAWLPWTVWSPWLKVSRAPLPPTTETPPTVPEG